MLPYFIYVSFILLMVLVTTINVMNSFVGLIRYVDKIKNESKKLKRLKALFICSYSIGIAMFIFSSLLAENAGIKLVCTMSMISLFIVSVYVYNKIEMMID